MQEQDMAGSDGIMQIHQLPPLRDLSRRAASFLRMARLALTGAATPAQLLAGGEEAVDGGLRCDPYYKSVSTEDDDWGSELIWPEEEDDESELLVDDDEGGWTTTARGAPRSSVALVGGGGAGGPLNKRSQVRDRPDATPGADVTAAAAAAAEPLIMRRATKRANDAVAVDHPFGCDRQGRESSSLLLVSS